MKKLKFRYLDSVLDSKFGSLQKQSKKGSLHLEGDNIIFQNNKTNHLVKKVVHIEKYEAKGFQVDGWLRLEYLDEEEESREIYITRRSFYHPSVEKIERKIKEMQS